MCTTGKPSTSPEASATGRPDRDPLATQDDPAKFLTQDSRTTGDGSARSTVEQDHAQPGPVAGSASDTTGWERSMPASRSVVSTLLRELGDVSLPLKAGATGTGRRASPTT